MAEHRVYTCLFPFGGIGAGALGFLQAQHPEARFHILGGLDFDSLACDDFQYLTGAPSWCVDVNDVTPEQLRELYGVEPPDVVFLSPPCKAASSLLSAEKARSEKYQRMNWLAYTWITKMLAAWGTKRPRLVLFENVPRIKKRAAKMLAEVKALLEDAGYVLHEGFHNCGIVGGLAQNRSRYLMIARHESVEHLLYQPPPQRVRGCGEVLGLLPLPGDPAAGPMHRLPKISWLNAIRLALIPAGGDWRDLPGVVPEGQRRGTVFKRKAVSAWEKPTDTIAGPGGNGVENVADPRAAWLGFSDNPGRHWNKYRVGSWAAPAGSVIGAVQVGSGAPSVADPRVRGWFGNVLCVTSWSSPVGTITAGMSPSNGAPSVADPRVELFHGSYGMQGWDAPATTVTGGAAVTTGTFAVADPRLSLGYATRQGTFAVTSWATPTPTVTAQSGRTGHCSGGLVADPRVPLGCAPRAGAYGVLGWTTAGYAVTASACLDNGAFAVADPRIPVPTSYPHGYGVLGWRQPTFTLSATTSVGCGAYAVADPRDTQRPPHLQGYDVMTWLEAAATLEHMPHAAPSKRGKGKKGAKTKAPKLSPWLTPTRPRPYPTIIVAADGTWHRPLTTLELAVLQGLPSVHRGEPLQLAGDSTTQREHIGNAVPVGAAKAIAEQMLKTLVAADEGGMFLSANAVWVAPEVAPLAAPGEVVDRG